MRATTERKALLEGLKAAFAAVPTGRSTLPALTHFLLRAESHQLTITGNNLEQAVVCKVPATITKVGTAAAPAKPLLNIIASARDDSVALTAVGKTTLQVIAGRATIKLEGIDPQDYPPVPRTPKSMKPINGLLEAMKTVAFSTATDESRPVLTTVAIMPIGERTDLVGADGYRLAVLSIKGKYPQALVPRATVDLAHKLLQGEEDVSMTVYVGQSPLLFFQSGGTTIVSQLVQGTYPKYDQLIPKGGTPLYFKPKDMLEALAQFRAFNGGKEVIVRLVSKANTLTMTRKSEDIGEVSVSIPSRGSCKIAVSLPYLEEAVRRCGEKAALFTTSAGAPMLFKGDNKDLIQVVMPMFVQW